MPQFDFYSFALQNFYVLGAFFGIYFFLLFNYLPHYAEVLKMRKKLIKYYGHQTTETKIELINLFYRSLFSTKK